MAVLNEMEGFTRFFFYGHFSGQGFCSKSVVQFPSWSPIDVHVNLHKCDVVRARAARTETTATRTTFFKPIRFETLPKTSITFPVDSRRRLNGPEQQNPSLVTEMGFFFKRVRTYGKLKKPLGGDLGSYVIIATSAP